MNYLDEINDKGFTIIENIFSEEEIEDINTQIESKFVNAAEVFAYRCFLKKYPEFLQSIYSVKFSNLVNELAGNHKIVRSIYFNKPSQANWIVNWHQDLTINLSNRKDSVGFKNWLPKGEYLSVNPPQEFLEDIITFRIHLDDCTSKNGALRVIPRSHLSVGKISINESDVEICEVKKGGILVMKPLLWHSSRRTENQDKRRVIHVEFCSLDLPNGLTWFEK